MMGAVEWMPVINTATNVVLGGVVAWIGTQIREFRNLRKDLEASNRKQIDDKIESIRQQIGMKSEIVDDRLKDGKENFDDIRKSIHELQRELLNRMGDVMDRQTGQELIKEVSALKARVDAMERTVGRRS
jgi:hypothetical protein